MIVYFFWLIYFDKEFVYKALKINIIFLFKICSKNAFFSFPFPSIFAIIIIHSMSGFFPNCGRSLVRFQLPAKEEANMALVYQISPT